MSVNEGFASAGDSPKYVVDVLWAGECGSFASVDVEFVEAMIQVGATLGA